MYQNCTRSSGSPILTRASDAAEVTAARSPHTHLGQVLRAEYSVCCGEIKRSQSHSVELSWVISPSEICDVEDGGVELSKGEAGKIGMPPGKS
jgi:hypothetical protein